MADATRHSGNCKRVFRRYDPDCPRCRELLVGAAPRAGWQSSRDAGPTLKEIREHNCKRAGCGPVCTFGDW